MLSNLRQSVYKMPENVFFFLLLFESLDSEEYLHGENQRESCQVSYRSSNVIHTFNRYYV